jgi:hypothetical protein
MSAPANETRPVQVSIDLEELEAIRDDLDAALHELLDAANISSDRSLPGGEQIFHALRLIRGAQAAAETALTSEVRS